MYNDIGDDVKRNENNNSVNSHSPSTRSKRVRINEKHNQYKQISDDPMIEGMPDDANLNNHKEYLPIVGDVDENTWVGITSTLSSSSCCLLMMLSVMTAIAIKLASGDKKGV